MKMKINFILGLLFTGLFLTINGLHQQKPPAQNHQANLQESEERKAKTEVVSRNTEFACKMYQDLAKRSKDKNIFFSPLSVSTSFSMLTMGAKDYTLSQLIDSLNLNKMPPKKIYQGFHYLIHSLNQPGRDLKLHLGNAVFIEKELRTHKSFLNDIRNVYEADVISMDLKDPKKAIGQINNYISKETHGEITNMVKNLDSGTSLLLINYIYFQAEWEKKFNPKDTEEDEFFLIDGRSVKVPMMYRGGKYKNGYDEELSCRILELPFKGNVTGLFILPDKGKLKNVEEGLNKDKLIQMSQSLKLSSVDVCLPKFSISGTYNMKKCLSDLGVTRIFDGSADLTRITPQKTLKVSQALHKAVLKMDEKGAEAAGGTGVETLPMTVPILFRLNHPFLLIIKDDITNSTLFMGRIMNPTSSKHLFEAA
ncbi:serpin A12-like [Monodelphis domestica]|uniref:Serpin A12-like n=1 Tax=Monodelphis domestica TaxID=13616 RepID=F6SC37_MONDO|nr:serpin A12-like [Monodelphis domestica]XP_016282067.1 serpin A12-like [Monodelphis domestica]XP_056667300.1 serpin A12-like [Monodelphis domestica]